MARSVDEYHGPAAIAAFLRVSGAWRGPQRLLLVPADTGEPAAGLRLLPHRQSVPAVLSAFVNAHRRATDTGVSLALVNPTGHVQRVLAMTGILAMLANPDADD
jgi:hypothetical protein